VSGKSKARREAKAADRAARGNQRAQADLQRRWHLTLKQQREINATYAKAAAEAQRVADSSAFITVKTGVVDCVAVHNTYEPHCVMEWREQMAGMDDMGGIDTALARGDGT
jgi:hypothetical protein